MHDALSHAHDIERATDGGNRWPMSSLKKFKMDGNRLVHPSIRTTLLDTPDNRNELANMLQKTMVSGRIAISYMLYGCVFFFFFFVCFCVSFLFVMWIREFGYHRIHNDLLCLVAYALKMLSTRCRRSMAGSCCTVQYSSSKSSAMTKVALMKNQKDRSEKLNK